MGQEERRGNNDCKTELAGFYDFNRANMLGKFAKDFFWRSTETANKCLATLSFTSIYTPNTRCWTVPSG
jgi:hypothetical protein